MAYYATLVSVMQLLEEITHDHYRYRNLALNNKQIMKSLHEKFNLLVGSLEDYTSNNDEAAVCLETRIRDVAYQAEYIIEYQISNLFYRSKVETIEMVLRHLISTFKKVILRKHEPQRFEEYFEYDQPLQKVKEEVDSLLEEVTRIKRSSHDRNEDVQLNYDSDPDVGGSEQAPNIGSTTVGFDEHLTTIKAQLCGDSCKFQIISIVGMGGIGKTTLAKNVFDDSLIAYHFHIRLWVTISQDYHIQRVLRSIEDSINVDNREKPKMNEGELPEYIYKHLKGRRYLIVMDDMWDTKVWDDVKRIFPDDHNGSRIMLTTRLSNVAGYAGTLGSLHQIKFLNKEQSWNLLQEKLFGQEYCPRELKDLGEYIADCCQGLPLAIVMVAGLLSNVSKARYEWKKIACNVSSIVTSSDDAHFEKILSLSFNHLPHHLKPCFLYMGVFPEDYEICASTLVRLWMAEGLLRPIESKSLEEVGEEYLKDLVNRNLVMMIKKRYDGEIKYCSIHDLLRELCTKRRFENFFHVLDKKIVGRSAYLSFYHRSSTRPDDSNRSCLRSILYFRDSEDSEGSLAYRCLRVLDAQRIKLRSFPYSVFNLFHLRYLAFGFLGNVRYRIPPTISRLRHLQTLIVDGVISLPSEIWMMPQLRHVFARCLYLPPVIPTDAAVAGKVHVLEYLQTLSSVINFTLTNEILEMIPNLKTLKVLSYENKWQQYWNNLAHLLQLEKLSVIFVEKGPRFVDPFPMSFAFPKNLKTLSLGGCKLPWKDMTVVGSLPKLEVLKLYTSAMEGEVWEPIEGEFLQLKFLLLEMLHLKHWRVEDIHFPRLEHLRISWCAHLKKIPLEIGEIPTLKLIEVVNNPPVADSAKKIQQEQQNMGNDILQVYVFPQNQ
ncbi:hypothetical protein BUALT_Bualt02G0118800 [Buddleja alternifolia]|uniref:Uncharacterized protein n=1 Tax=Buddleja alternifolia TaxID=168488 RepID=A0AAV6Y6I6_9LAMI|nr:hypothetical protein BUALT_Bualt02G0118800 [Buddleja alternifolia]